MTRIRPNLSTSATKAQEDFNVTMRIRIQKVKSLSKSDTGPEVKTELEEQTQGLKKWNILS